MKKNWLPILTIPLLFCLAIPLAKAQESTNSAVSENEIKEKLEQRMEEVSKKDLEKVKQSVEQQTESKLYAWVGTIEKVGAESLEIETKNGLRSAQIASQAAILKYVPQTSKKAIEPEEIETSWFVIAIGPKQKQELILAKRLILMTEAPETTPKKTYRGTVVEIDEEKVTVEENDQTTTLTIDEDKLKFKIAGIKSPTLEDIQIQDYLTAVATIDEDGQLDQLKAVMVVPGQTNPQAEENKIETGEE